MEQATRACGNECNLFTLSSRSRIKIFSVYKNLVITLITAFNSFQRWLLMRCFQTRVALETGRLMCREHIIHLFTG